MASLRYPGDLNDDEWTVLAPLIPAAQAHGRPRSVDNTFLRPRLMPVQNISRWYDSSRTARTRQRLLEPDQRMFAQAPQ